MAAPSQPKPASPKNMMNDFDFPTMEQSNKVNQQKDTSNDNSKGLIDFPA